MAHLEVSDYLQAALNDVSEHSQGFFHPKTFAALWLNDAVLPLLTTADVVDLFVPVVVDVGCMQTSQTGGQRAKPSGKLEIGCVITCETRFILAWQTGVIRLHTHAQVIDYGAVASVAPFTMRAKLDDNPAFEFFDTGSKRYAITFTNNIKYERKVDPTEWWRDRLVKRLLGWQPVFEGASVVRWVAPPAVVEEVSES